MNLKKITLITSLVFSQLSFVNAQKNYDIPFTGNAFEIKNTNNTPYIGQQSTSITAANPSTTRIYFKLLGTGKLNLALNVSANENGSITSIFNGKSKKIKFTKNDSKISLGKYKVKKQGYYYVDLISNQGNINVTSLNIEGSAVSNGVIYSDKPDYFYWSRRGPSCHLSYTIPTDKNVSYYYNEIVVPKDQDVIGSYFMANGFGEGYFGIQVNSQSERRVLFSVWSPFVTDDPKSIPDDQKIKLLKKGQGVYTGEFGNEGSGGQSFLKYNWKSDTTYKFLLKGIPTDHNSTIYTAWFFATDESQWKLIASFERPQTSTYLKRFHSFLENFIPNQGYMTRKAHYNNQWVYDGEWKKVNEAKLTVDATYNAKQRVDATGGTTNTGFFLKMGGFFNEIENPGTKFIFNSTSNAPNINFNTLP